MIQAGSEKGSRVQVPRGESYSSSQKGLWLEWSEMEWNAMEIKGEPAGDESSLLKIQMECSEDLERNLSVVFVWGLWGFYWGWWSDVYVPLGIQEPVRINTRTWCYSLEPEGLGLEDICDSFFRSFLPGPSLNGICSREIINFLFPTRGISFTRKTYAICVAKHV